ncbi:MAG: hypothetical protein O2960_02975 [Verrucomicrobia bacterium]|nr:hypothetical protein [Verrucomicrobiota bacterium]
MKPLAAIFPRVHSIPHSAWTDAGLIMGFLVLSNSVFSPLDFGWLQVHPSPYFILPILVGCRYGFAAGIIIGLFTAATIFFGLNLLAKTPFAEIVQQRGYLLGTFVFAGSICGEIQRTFRKKEVQLSAHNENLQRHLKELDVDLALLREAKAELEGLLATQDCELSTLDSELRRLFDSDAEELFQSLLLLLNRQLRISDAAVYLPGPESLLIRKAIYGQPDRLPKQLKSDSAEIVALALNNKTTVTLPEIWRGTIPKGSDYLMVVPFLDSHEKVMAVLIVSGMPFISLNRKAISLITLVCRWASRIVERRTRLDGSSRVVNNLENQRIFDASFFRQHTELALNSFRSHGLPSSIVLFTIPKCSGVSQERLETAIMANVRSGDCPAVLDLPDTHLAVLLPLTGERGVGIFVDRILMNCRKDPTLAEHIRKHWIKFDSHEDTNGIWNELTRHVEESSGGN